MKRSIIVAIVLWSTVSLGHASTFEQTICYSNSGGASCKLASLGDGSNLDGGKCNGSTLPQMNQRGWRLVTIGPSVGTCTGGFAVLFEKRAGTL